MQNNLNAIVFAVITCMLRLSRYNIYNEGCVAV